MTDEELREQAARVLGREPPKQGVDIGLPQHHDLAYRWFFYDGNGWDISEESATPLDWTTAGALLEMPDCYGWVEIEDCNVVLRGKFAPWAKPINARNIIEACVILRASTATARRGDD